MKYHKDMYVQIGNRISIVREKEGLTQAKLADILDKSIQFVSDIERGVSGPSIYTIIQICKALHVSSDYILMGVEENNEKSEIAKRIQYLSSDEEDELRRAAGIVHDFLGYGR